MTEKEGQKKREKAIAIIDNFSIYHAGTAIAVGALGGQFGADRFALTALTVTMIEQICNVYGVKSRTAKNIHIARAVYRLTKNGTMIAHTILNWVPLGSFANGATTYFLTRGAGMKCINEIEHEQMTGMGQFINIGKDWLKTKACNAIDNTMNDLSGMSTEDVLEKTRKTLGANLTADLKIESIIEAIDKIPTDLTKDVGAAIGGALKANIRECMFKDPKSIDSSKLLRDMLFDAICGVASEHTKLTREEIEFRFIHKNNEYDGTFNEFLRNTTERYDALAKGRDMITAVRFAYSSISNEIKLRMGVTSEEITKSVLNNPYDNEIESVYCIYLPMIYDSDNKVSALAKAAMLYQNLCVINYRYKVPNLYPKNADDKLIYFIAGRIKNKTILFANLTTQDIAFILSEYISQHLDMIQLKVSLPVIGYNNDICTKEDSLVNVEINNYWLKIAQNSQQKESIWSDGVAYYIYRKNLSNIFNGDHASLTKDDKLIYTTAEILKNNLELLKAVNTEVVAYYIAETFDRYIN